MNFEDGSIIQSIDKILSVPKYGIIVSTGIVSLEKRWNDKKELEFVVREMTVQQFSQGESINLIKKPFESDFNLVVLKKRISQSYYNPIWKYKAHNPYESFVNTIYYKDPSQQTNWKSKTTVGLLSGAIGWACAGPIGCVVSVYIVKSLGLS